MGAAYTKPAEVESVAFPAFKESSDAPFLKDKNISIMPGTKLMLYCCVAPGVENGDLIEPEHNGKLMPRMYGAAKKWDWGSEASTTADKEAFWAASEAAAGKWDF